MAERICQCCGRKFQCGLADDPNVCRSCLLSDFVGGARVPTGEPATSPTPTPPAPALCDVCHNPAPTLTIQNGKRICPTCRPKTLPASHQFASSNPDPLPVNHATDSRAHTVLHVFGGDGGLTPPAAACGEFSSEACI